MKVRRGGREMREGGKCKSVEESCRNGQKIKKKLFLTSRNVTMKKANFKSLKRKKIKKIKNIKKKSKKPNQGFVWKSVRKIGGKG
jgi:hypothetical protein